MHAASDDATEAHAKAHHRGATAVTGDGEHVEVRVVVQHDVLHAGGALEGLEAVAGLGRGLVVLLLGRLVHLALQESAQLSHVAVEEPRPRRDQLRVALGVDRADARPRALADVEEQAGPSDALVVVVLVLGARAKREGLDQFVHRRAQRAHVDERTEVAHALHVLAARYVRRGEVGAGVQGDVGEALVVLQAHVVARLVVLDQFVLEDQRVEFGRRDDPLDRRRLGHQRLGLVVEALGPLEVVPEP